MPAAPSLLIVPYRSKTGRLYSQIPVPVAPATTGAGDFTVTRNTTATRLNSAGAIESVASGIPRLDYYTSGGTVGCPALLVEPAATNGILNSADTTTSWSIVSGTLSSASIDVIGVSGNNLTVLVTGSTIAGAGRIVRGSNNVALASGSTYTISFFVKQTATHTIGGYYAVTTGAASGDIGASFNVSGSFSSGSIKDNASFTNRIRRVERWGTDVFRCSETFTMSASGTLTNFHLAPLVSTTSTSNSAVGTQLGFAAPQIELGSVPTSFIPTTAGTGSRSADVISVTGAVSGSIGQTEGTIYAEMQADAAGAASNFLIIGDGVNADDIVFIGKDGANARATVFANSVMVFNQVLALTGGVIKAALAYKGGDTAFYVNGSLVASGSTAYTFSSSFPRVGLGVNGFQFLAPGAISRYRAAALYTTRLTNAELATLTTL